MSAAELTEYDPPLDEARGEAGSGPREGLTLAPDVVEVRRNAGLAALLGGAAAAVAIGYLRRATQGGVAWDWAMVAVMGVLAVVHLAALVDARTPLLVADAQGVRLRLGRAWSGLPWGALQRIEHQPRRGLLRDGRLVLVARNAERVVAELDRRGRRQSRLSRRLYGAPLAVPLGLSTRVVGAGDDGLTVALDRLAAAGATVVEVPASPRRSTGDDSVAEPALPPEPVGLDELFRSDELSGPDELSGDEPMGDADPDVTEATGPVRRGRWHDPRPAVAAGISGLAARLERRGGADTPEDLEPDHAGHEDLTADVPGSGRGAAAVPLEVARLEQPDSPTPPAQPDSGAEGRWGARVRPIARAGDPVEPLVIDDFEVEPADDPVVGPELAAARTRLSLSVDQLAERTRIRPHVIESIEVDDFAPCGGDFYARGHLRTLARVLGVDAAPLLRGFDERYAHAPINPRRVFEAELATGAHGSIRGTRGGPNWSVLVAAIMTVVLAWSIARLVMDTPVELQQPAPVLNGSGGVDNAAPALADPVRVAVTAARGVHLVVLDGEGATVFDGDLAIGDTESLSVVPPVRMTASDGGAVTVSVAGTARGPLGESGREASATFLADPS